VVQTSYDIEMAYGEEIKVESAKNEGSKFMFTIPIKIKEGS